MNVEEEQKGAVRAEKIFLGMENTHA
ncbi:hypothetical protein C5S53_02325 [Methanophagales archaeon]|nr:hypothetical protein C5S53_02325 [Methanophagales archaeon]